MRARTSVNTAVWCGVPNSAKSAAKCVAKVLAIGAMLSVCGLAHAQVRIGQWNITNYGVAASARDPSFRTALYGVGPTGQFAPDLLVVQEIIQSVSGQSQQNAGDASVAAFLANLNSAAGSPGDWAAAPYLVNGGDTGNALFYRTSRWTLVSTSSLTTNTGTGATQAPRDTGRWVVRPFGYSSSSANVVLYGSHFKAGSTNADILRREPEAQRIRLDSNALPAGTPFMLCADFNVQRSDQSFYQWLVGNSGSPSFTTGTGRFFDPINSPGGGSSGNNWENNANFQKIHTQDPATAMDSRLDQILISGNLRDGQGFDYLPATPGGNILAAWNLSTFADPNHSYRCWGNDGTSFNAVLRTTGNAMVGATIAQALISSAGSGGHLPILLDMKVPAKLGAPTGTIDFGTVPLNSMAQFTVSITNAADVARFSRDGTGYGIDGLTYTLSASSGFTAPSGTFERSATAAPAAANTHVITMNTSTAGTKTGTLTITTDDPDNPTRVIQLTGVVGNVVTDPCANPPTGSFDVNGDGVASIEDLYAWFVVPTDVDQSGGTPNAADLALLQLYLRRCESTDVVNGRR